MAMRVLVSRCILFCVLPLGPIIKPIKLYPGYSFSGTKIFRFFFVGRQSWGGRKRWGHRATSHPARSFRWSLSFCSTRCGLVLVRVPLLSYLGGGDGLRSRSGLLSVNSFSSNFLLASRNLAYCCCTSGSSESAGVGPPSAAPMPCANGLALGADRESLDFTPNLDAMFAKCAFTASADF